MTLRYKLLTEFTTCPPPMVEVALDRIHSRSERTEQRLAIPKNSGLFRRTEETRYADSKAALARATPRAFDHPCGAFANRARSRNQCCDRGTHGRSLLRGCKVTGHQISTRFVARANAPMSSSQYVPQRCRQRLPARAPRSKRIRCFPCLEPPRRRGLQSAWVYGVGTKVRLAGGRAPSRDLEQSDNRPRAA